MNLCCDQFESRDAAVSLQLVPLLGVNTRPEWGAIVAALSEMASRVDAEPPLVPLSQPYTLFHLWGHEPGPPLPAGTLRVYIGPVTGRTEYGSAAPGGWSATEALPRSWGGFIGLDLDLIATHGVDVGTVARHEFGHVLGLDHSADGSSLMAPTLAQGQVKDLTHADANALDALGWDAAPRSHIPGYTRVYGQGVTLNGWVMIPNGQLAAHTAGHFRVADPEHGWAYSPVDAVITPL